MIVEATIEEQRHRFNEYKSNRKERIRSIFEKELKKKVSAKHEVQSTLQQVQKSAERESSVELLVKKVLSESQRADILGSISMRRDQS